MDRHGNVETKTHLLKTTPERAHNKFWNIRKPRSLAYIEIYILRENASLGNVIARGEASLAYRRRTFGRGMEVVEMWVMFGVQNLATTTP